MLTQIIGQSLIDRRFHMGFQLRVAQSGLCLPLELGIDQLDADYRHQPFPHVLAGEVRLILFDNLILASIIIQCPGEGSTKAGEMRPAVNGIDAIGKGKGGLRESVVILKSDFDSGAIDRFRDIDWVRVNHRSIAIDLLSKANYTALEIEADLPILPLIPEIDPDSSIEIGHFSESLGQNIEVIVQLVKDILVREKGDGGAAPLRVTDYLDAVCGNPAAKFLAIDLAIAFDIHLEPG
ncbi:MAG: hypothetical protein DDT26_02760 [Dehalococcoidia bacterium]|nr:hypothetical protein [Chloroflexota bacterium]